MVKNKSLILAIAETCGNSISPATYELAAFAEKLADQKNHLVEFVFMGPEAETHGLELAKNTGFDVTAVVTGKDFVYGSELRKEILESLVNRKDPHAVCAVNTSLELETLPALSIRLNSMSVTGVRDVVREGENTYFVKPVCGGRLEALVPVSKLPVMITMEPGFFKLSLTPCREGKVHRETWDGEKSPKEGVSFQGNRKRITGNKELSSARVIVAAGLGAREKESLEVVENFKNLLSGSALAGSRPLIDMGLMPYKKQVGITGAVVSPEIYIACGISGSTQHMAGMKGSGYVISVNNDPNAAIFMGSDLCIIEEVVPFLETMEKILTDR